MGEVVIARRFSFIYNYLHNQQYQIAASAPRLVVEGLQSKEENRSNYFEVGQSIFWL